MKDLAPDIYRQRLVVEGIPSQLITELMIKEYLTKLSQVANMTLLIEPVMHKSPMYGWAGWIHWETSGAHFYAWDQPRLFFSVDIYTCKQFDVATVVAFTKEAFGAVQIESKEF